MMKFFFHLENEANFNVDDVGKVFVRKQDAIDHAFAMARQLGEEEKWLGWSLRVIDAHNAEVISVPILHSIVSGSAPPEQTGSSERGKN